MVGNRVRSAGPLAMALAALFLMGSAHASAQTVDVTGTWNMEVVTETGTTNPTMTLEQHDGGHFTGHYSSATLGEAELEGSVTGMQVRFTFQAELQGQPIPVAYAGTIDANGVMTGTIDLAGGLATGTFTARRASE